MATKKKADPGTGPHRQWPDTTTTDPLSKQQARALLALQQATCDLREAVAALRRRCDEIEATCDAAGKGSSMHCPLGQPAQEALKYAARRDALIDAATLLEIPAQEIAAASAVRRIT